MQNIFYEPVSTIFSNYWAEILPTGFVCIATNCALGNTPLIGGYNLISYGHAQLTLLTCGFSFDIFKYIFFVIKIS